MTFANKSVNKPENKNMSVSVSADRDKIRK